MEVYFPIESNAYVPKADKDIFGITKQQLSNGLNETFGCHYLLSSMVLNMILNKFENDEISIRIDPIQMNDVILCL